MATQVVPSRKRQNGAPPAPLRVTREIGIKELKNTASEVIDRVGRGERVVVTRRNKLAAVILSIDESLEFVLAHAEELVRARGQLRDEQAPR